MNKKFNLTMDKWFEQAIELNMTDSTTLRFSFPRLNLFGRARVKEYTNR